MQWLLYFFMYSFLGWVCECIYCSIPKRHFINRGFLAGPYCPIYGCGAMLVLYLLMPYEGQPLLLCIAAIIITSMLEYATSYVMEKLFHTKWWDYSTYPCNLHGRVCLKNSLMFGIMALVVFYGIHPLIMYLIAMIPSLYQYLLGSFISLLFITDAMFTVHALLRRNKDFAELEDSIKELHALFKTANLFPLNEPFSAAVQRVLDNTDADEIILLHIDHIKDMAEQKISQRKASINRILKAFPTHKEAISRDNTLALIRIINEHKRKS